MKQTMKRRSADGNGLRNKAIGVVVVALLKKAIAKMETKESLILRGMLLFVYSL